jgi:hypothetical protein
MVDSLKNYKFNLSRCLDLSLMNFHGDGDDDDDNDCSRLIILL